MANPSIEDCMAALDEWLHDFDNIARTGLATYRQYPPEILVEHDTRANACCVYSHMVAEADRRFLGKKSITSLDIRGLKVWVFGDHSVIRFKKMDEDGKSRNYPTKQAKDFDYGNQLPGLPEPAIRLSVGYLPDPTGTSVRRTQIARPAGKGIEWCAAIVPETEWQPGKKRWENVTKQQSFG